MPPPGHRASPPKTDWLRCRPPSKKNPPATGRASPEMMRMPAARRGSPNAANKEAQTATPAPLRGKGNLARRERIYLDSPNPPARERPPGRNKVPEKRNPQPQNDEGATPTTSPAIRMEEHGNPAASKATFTGATLTGSEGASNLRRGRVPKDPRGISTEEVTAM